MYRHAEFVELCTIQSTLEKIDLFRRIVKNLIQLRKFVCLDCLKMLGAPWSPNPWCKYERLRILLAGLGQGSVWSVMPRL